MRYLSSFPSITVVRHVLPWLSLFSMVYLSRVIKVATPGLCVPLQAHLPSFNPILYRKVLLSLSFVRYVSCSSRMSGLSSHVIIKLIKCSSLHSTPLIFSVIIVAIVFSSYLLLLC